MMCCGVADAFEVTGLCEDLTVSTRTRNHEHLRIKSNAGNATLGLDTWPLGSPPGGFLLLFHLCVPAE